MKKILITTTFILFSAIISFATVHNVSIVNFAFSPSTLTINVGDTVTWTNNAGNAHTTTSGSSCTSNTGIWDATINAGLSFSFRFDNAGSFPYHCNIHCSMTGTITVGNPNGVTPASAINLNVSTYPNPFSQSSSVQFYLSEGGKVKIELFDMQGEKIYETLEQNLPSGQQTMVVPGKNLREGMFVAKIYVNGVPAGSSFLVKEK